MEKCEAVKLQVSKIKEKLEELYNEDDLTEEEEAQNPTPIEPVITPRSRNPEDVKPDDLSTLNNEESIMEDPDRTEDEDFQQVLMSNEDEEIKLFKEMKNSRLLDNYFAEPENGHAEQQIQAPKSPQAVTQSLPSTSAQEVVYEFKPLSRNARPLPGIAMKPDTRLCESSSTRNAAKIIEVRLDRAYKQWEANLKWRESIDSLSYDDLKNKYFQNDPIYNPRSNSRTLSAPPPPQNEEFNVSLRRPSNAPPTSIHQSQRQTLYNPHANQPPQRHQSYQPPSQFQSLHQSYQPRQQQPQQQQQQQSFENQVLQRTVYNERVQETVGNKVGDWAQDEQVQGRVGSQLSSMANNKQYQGYIGDHIARNSDNVLVSSLARNEKVQSAIGTTVSNTVGNKEVQKAVGNTVHKMATDKEVQKKVAKGFVTVGKGAWSGTKMIGNFAYNQYNESQK
ncbi:hypothetical protein AKO1_007479 [Acrasis kona]|uniref:Uncharacterized protein n=1 Tax=Acrasis kona TaxID=1008807 RepID=A0AAW2YT47_9EUKA